MSGRSGPLTGRRILVVNWRDPWHSLAGGSERYAWELAEGLLEAGANVEFWTARDRGQAPTARHHGVLVRRRWGTYGFYLGVWIRLLGRRLSGRLPDLLFDMDCGIPAFTPLVLPRRTPVVLVVHHVHQDQFTTAMRWPMAGFGRFLERRLMPTVYADAAATVAVSDSTMREMKRQLGWTAAVRVVHNGVDPAHRVEGGSSRLEIGGARICVLGRLVRHKRVDVVLQALALVRERRPDATLDVVGTGPEAAALADEVARLDLGDRVRLHGFVSEAEKSHLLASADLHVCASDAEGWGLVVLEAAGHGVPTVGRDVPGICDSVEHGATGWLIAAPDEDLVPALAGQMLAALSELADPARRSAYAAACEARAQRYSWRHTRGQLVSLTAAQFDHLDS